MRTLLSLLRRIPSSARGTVCFRAMVFAASLTACGDKDGGDDCTTCIDGTTSLPDGYVLDDMNFTCSADPLPNMEVHSDASGAFLSNDDVEIRAGAMLSTCSNAADDWNDVGADVQVRVGDSVTTASTAEIRSQAEPPSDKPTALAGVNCSPSSEGACRSLRCEIIVLESNYSSGTLEPLNWTTSPSPSGDQYSLPYAVVHEFGHVLGLGNQTSTDPPSIMYEFTSKGVSYEGIQEVDQQALRHLYGSR